MRQSCYYFKQLSWFIEQWIRTRLLKPVNSCTEAGLVVITTKYVVPFLLATILWIFLPNNSLYVSNVFMAEGQAHRLEGILSFSFYIGAAPRCGRPSTRWKSQLRFGRPRKKTATGPWDDRLLTCQPFQNLETNTGNQPWGY